MEKIVSFFLLLIVLASAKYIRITNINNKIDKEYEAENRQITKDGWSTIPLPDGRFNGARVSNITAIGLNTVKRTGDCWLTVLKNGSAIREEHFGFQLGIVSVGRVEYEAVVNSAVIVSQNNSIFFRMFYDNATCFHNVTDFMFESIGYTFYEFPPPKRRTFMCLAEELNYKMTLMKRDLETMYTYLCEKRRNTTAFTQDLPTIPSLLRTLYTLQ